MTKVSNSVFSRLTRIDAQRLQVFLGGILAGGLQIVLQGLLAYAVQDVGITQLAGQHISRQTQVGVVVHINDLVGIVGLEVHGAELAPRVQRVGIAATDEDGRVVHAKLLLYIRHQRVELTHGHFGTDASALQPRLQFRTALLVLVERLLHGHIDIEDMAAVLVLGAVEIVEPQLQTVAEVGIVYRLVGLLPAQGLVAELLGLLTVEPPPA